MRYDAFAPGHSDLFDSRAVKTTMSAKERAPADRHVSITFSPFRLDLRAGRALLLAKPWRVLAPIEGLTGLLMCGLSTGLFFAVVSRIHRARHVNTTGSTT